MALPSSVSFFHVLAIVIGAIAFCISLKNHNDAAQWNKCAPTLRVNHCPIQSPEETYKCQNARLQMDGFLAYFVQKIRRKDYRELNAFYILASIVTMTVGGYVLYFFLPFSGQLCLAKALHSVIIVLYGLCIYWSIQSTLAYSSIKAPNGGRVCQIGSTMPVQDFGIPLLKKCFADYHICQDGVLVLVGVGIEGLAVLCHALVVFSAVWECQTQIDPEDWGTVDDLPPEDRITRPEPPVYEILTEAEKKVRAQLEKAREKAEREHRKEVEKRRKAVEKERQAEAERIAKEHQKLKHEREKAARLEEAERKKEELKLKAEEEKRKREEEQARRLALRKQREEEEKREREERQREKEEKKKMKQGG